MLYREIIVFLFEIQTKHVSLLSRQKAEFLYVKQGGTTGFWKVKL